MIPSFRPLREFSFWIHPPDQWLMAVLRAYVDDSGDEGPGHAALSMAGYIATIEEWARFEQAWIRVLTEFGAPYLHMKEFKERYGAFKTWPASKDRDADLLAKLAGVIGKAGLCGFGAVIVLDDLKRFNDDHKLCLNAKALAIYASMIELRRLHDNDCIDVILDRMYHGHKTVAIFKNYASNELLKGLEFFPLSENGENHSRNMPSLQVADFLAWEVRKEYELRKCWYKENPEGLYHVLPIHSKDITHFRRLFKWDIGDRRVHINRPLPYEPHRTSLIALDSATTINAHIWNYHMLKQLHEIKGGDWSAVRVSAYDGH